MFAFSLARDLGKTMAEMADMSSAEFTYWMAFYDYQNKQIISQSEKAKK